MRELLVTLGFTNHVDANQNKNIIQAPFHPKFWANRMKAPFWYIHIIAKSTNVWLLLSLILYTIIMAMAIQLKYNNLITSS